jgi:hypothetical protein
MLTIDHIGAQVERPVACAGKGQYMAIVHYGSPGGQLYRRVFKYSHKDPRYKDEAEVLRDITQMIGSRYRKFVLAISVIKRCLHPKSDQVPKNERSMSVERVFSWVVQHDNSTKQTPHEAYEQHLEDLLHGQTVQTVALPYTNYELKRLPVKDIVTTNYHHNTYATIGLRGVERHVQLRDILPSFANRRIAGGAV